MIAKLIELPPNPILAGTGHRPDKIATREKAVRSETRDILLHYRPSYVVSGFAQGFDMWLAEETLSLGFRLYAAVPFPRQEKRWPSHVRSHYHAMLKCAMHVHYVSSVPPRNYDDVVDMLHERNAWMVDHAHGVIACYNGDPRGGTAHCVRYARTRKRPLIEFNPYKLEAA